MPSGGTYLAFMAITPAPDDNSFGRLLRTWREQRGLRQEDLAKTIDTTKSVVSRWEIGERSPDMESFFRTCAALELSPVQFFEGPNALHDGLSYALTKPLVREYMLDRLRGIKTELGEVNLSPQSTGDQRGR
jgi:transcriptional regulator with XRE-family HTH domain